MSFIKFRLSALLKKLLNRNLEYVPFLPWWGDLTLRISKTANRKKDIFDYGANKHIKFHHDVRWCSVNLTFRRVTFAWNVPQKPLLFT